MPVSDNDYMLRDGTVDLVVASSPETGTGVFVGPGPLNGMKVRMYVPEYGGTTPTLDVVINECDTIGGSYDLVGTFPQITEASGYYEIHIHWTKKYLQYVATLTGTLADYGAVTIGLTPGQLATS